MIKNVLSKLGPLRATLAVRGVMPFLIATSAFAQVGSTEPTPAAPAATPATASGTGAIADSAPGVDAAAQDNAGAATTDRVIVTGSYIPTAETESALPVTVYTATVLQKQGAQTPVEGLRQLPSFVGNTVTENDSNGGDGSAAVSLRGIGPTDTLTLINGRRAFNHVVLTTYTNVNTIPIGATSRTEILKDGASAIYGSDAVAGVVNFILLNGPGEAPYEGAELFALYGNTTDTDARVRQFWIRGGVATDKVAVAAAAEYYDRENIFARDREISATGDQSSLGGFNNNSPTFAGRVTANGSAQVLLDSSENQVNRGSYRPFDSATGLPGSGGTAPGTDPARFNFRLFSPAIPAQEKYNYYAAGSYKVFGEGLQLYGDILYSKVKQDNGLAPAPFTIPLGRYRNENIRTPQFPNGISNGRNPDGTLNPAIPDNSTAAQRQVIRNSPFNPFGNDITSLSYRLTQELGNRRSFFDYDFWRYNAGLKGNFNLTGNNFLSYLGYDTGIVYARSDQLQIDSGDATRGGIYREILAGRFNPFIGGSAPLVGTAPVYVNGVATGAVAPYDNAAAAQSASYLGRSFFYERNFLADGKIFGNLLPNLYQGGIGFNLGGEYRQSRVENIADPVQRSGDQLGFSQGTNSKYITEVYSIFGELSLPIITSSMNVTGIRSFEVSVAGRYEEFENRDQFGPGTAEFNNDITPRISVRYQPIADVTLRFSYGQSFLSPSANLLFQPVVQNFPALFDPGTGQTLQPRNGVIQSGNPDLVPEETDSYTAGIVITPKFLPGFTATVDFYQLFTRNVILTAANFSQLALSANGNFIAAGGAVADAPFADIITREEQNIPTQILAGNQNAGKRLVNGMDITAAYQLPWTTFGTFTLSGGYNYFFTWKAEPIDGVGTTNFLGDYTSSQPLAPGAIPYHKGFVRGEYEWKGFNLVTTVNYIASYNDDSGFLAASNIVGGTNTNPQYDLYRRVSDYITLDAQLSYEFVQPEAEPAADPKAFSKDGKGSAGTGIAGAATGTFLQRLLWGTKLTVGVNNAFDRNPPTVLGAFNDNYDTSLYSIRNRYYYLSVNKKF